MPRWFCVVLIATAIWIAVGSRLFVKFNLTWNDLWPPLVVVGVSLAVLVIIGYVVRRLPRRLRRVSRPEKYAP